MKEGKKEVGRKEVASKEGSKEGRKERRMEKTKIGGGVQASKERNNIGEK